MKIAIKDSSPLSKKNVSKERKLDKIAVEAFDLKKSSTIYPEIFMVHNFQGWQSYYEISYHAKIYMWQMEHFSLI